jgi:hypothetical protein
MRILRVVLLVIIVLILVLFSIRLILPSQVDDVNPFMNCSDKVLDRGDVYFVVPKFGSVPIDDVDNWCSEILVREGKELAMHGVYHTFGEFGVYRDEVYFGEGVEIFKRCFGFSPERFKPGHLKFDSKNDWIRGDMEVDLVWNQVFHKVYHCGDAGLFPNWLVRVF